MADNLQPVGVSAVIEHLNDYLRGADQLQRATDGMAKGVDNAAKSTQKGGDAVGQFGKDAARAAKDAEGFGTHIGQLADKFGGLFLKLAPIAGAITGAFAVGKGVQAANELGAAIFRLQQTTNLSAEDASRLKFVFDETGVSFQQGERAIIKFSRALGGVADLEDGIAIPTGKGMANALFQLGIRTEDAEGKTKPLTEVLADLADVFQKMPEGVEKTALATNLFGRNGKDLIPFLNEGRAGIEDLAKEADKLGLVLDQNTVNSIRQNELATKHFHAALEGISVQLGLVFLPALTLAIQVGTKLAVAFNQKVVPVIKTFNGLINFQLQRFVTAVGPGVVKIMQQIGKAAEVAGKAFTLGFIKGGLDTSQFSGKMKIIAGIFSLFGASVRYSIDQVKAIINFFRIAGEVIQAVASDFTNLARIAEFLPSPLKDIVDRIFILILKGKDLIQWLLDLGRGVNDVTGGPLDKLTRIADRLAKFIIPALGTAFTVFLGVLSVGVVVGFANAIGGLITTFGNFGPVKIFTNLIGDFLKGIGKTFKLAIDLAGDALQGVGKILGFIGDIAGKVFNFTVNLAGDAVEFLKGFAEGLFHPQDVTQTINQQVKISPEDEAKLHPQDETQVIKQKVEVSTGVEDQGKDAGNNFLSGFEGGIAGLFGEKFLEKISKAFSKQAVQRLLIETGILAAFAAVGEAAGAVFAAAVAIAASPVGLVIAAILAVAIATTLIIIFRREIKHFIDAHKAEIAGFIAGGIVGALIVKFHEQIGRFFQELPHFIATALGTGLGAVGALIAIAIVAGLIILPGLMFKLIRSIDRRLFAVAKEIGGVIVEGIVAGVEAGFGLLRTAVGAIADRVGTVIEGVPGFFAKLPGRIAASIPQIVAVFKDLPHIIPHLFELTVDASIDFLRDLPRLIPHLFGLTIDASVAVLKEFPGFVEDILRKVVDLFQPALDLIKKIVGGALDYILGLIGDWAGGVVSGFTHVWDEANRITGGALDDAVGEVGDKLSTIADDVDRFVGKVLGFFGILANGIQEIFSGIGGIALTGFDIIKQAILTAVHGVASIIGDVLDKLGTALEPFTNLPFGIGGDVSSLQKHLDDAARILHLLGGSAISGGGFSQGDINALQGPVNALAGGTNGPLPGATFASVAEQGPELALLRHGHALLPAGTEVLPANVTSALLSLPAMARAGGAGSVSIAMPFEINGSQINLDDVRATAHRVLDEAFASARSRVTRRGVPLTSEIG